MVLKNNNLDFEFLAKIFKKPNWYLVIYDFLKEYIYERPKVESEEFQKIKNNFLEFTGYSFDNNLINLGEHSIDFDSYRKPIDTIVIHHSNWNSSISIDTMNIFQMLNVYAKTFSMEDRPFYGTPLTSEHYWNNKLTFLSYHYIIMPDGSFINPLKDEAVGWHCGNWDYNCRSIGICFHDELKEKFPSSKAIQTAREIIQKYPNTQILGHREIKDTTICPGNLFLGDQGWKKFLQH